MNGTRKQIIELIEPYMDKTLSEGCLYIAKCSDASEGYKIDRYWKLGENGQIRKLLEDIKILGHYDITSILKYIRNKGFPLSPYGDEFIGFMNGQTDIPSGDCIPNKPLHLYTEQEEKDLLVLLQKLGA